VRRRAAPAAAYFCQRQKYVRREWRTESPLNEPLLADVGFAAVGYDCRKREIIKGGDKTSLDV